MGEHDDTGTTTETGQGTPSGAEASGAPEETGEATTTETGAGTTPAAEASGAPEETGEGLSPELIAKALRGAIQRKLAELGLIAGDDGALEATGEAAERLRAGAKRVALDLMGDLSSQIQRLADGALRPKGPPGGAAMARDLQRQAAAGDNVIDLDAARRARSRGPLAEAEERIAGALRDSFHRYLAEHAPPAEDGVPGHVKIDGAFVREHGGRLLASLFGTFASAMLPPSVDVDARQGAAATAAQEATDQEPAGTAPASPERAQADAEAGEQAGAPEEVRVVEVKLDLPGLFRDLLPPPPK